MRCQRAYLCIVVVLATAALRAIAAEGEGESFDYTLGSLKPRMDALITLLPPHFLIPSVVASEYEPLFEKRATTHRFASENADLTKMEHTARAAEQAYYAAADNSAVCLRRQGDDVGAGVRWSLNDGFGVYWQGRGLRELQRLIGMDEMTEICPPGDPSAMCKTMPKKVCD